MKRRGQDVQRGSGMTKSVWRNGGFLIVALTLMAFPSWAGQKGSPKGGPSPTRETRELELARGTESSESLWSSALEYFDHEQDASARQQLDRYLVRYPGGSHVEGARLTLSVLLLRRGQTREALTVLRQLNRPLKGLTIARDLGAYRSKILLGQAYLNVGRLHEAELLAEELLVATRGSGSPGVESGGALLRAEALLIQAETRLRRHQRSEKVNDDWDLSISSARLALDGSPWSAAGEPGSVLARISPLRSEIEKRWFWMRNRSALEKCSQFAERGGLDEGRVRAQLDQRGVCLTSALRDLRDLLVGEKLTLEERSPGRKWQMDYGRSVFSDWEEAFAQFEKKASRPPSPPGKRTPEELKTYYFELEPILELVVREWARRSLEVIDAWKTQSQAAPELSKHQELQSLRNRLEKSQS